MSAPQEFLTFGVADELYGLPIRQVREIMGLPAVTRMPNAPSFFRGVINLRGAIVPLVDLREEFGLPAGTYTKYTIVIVAEVLGTTVGLIADRVVDVASVAEEAIRAPPAQLSARVRPEFVAGLVETPAALLVLLDLDRMLTDEKLGILRSAGAAA